MRKIFFFDIDGTLLPNGFKKPLESTKYAISELKKKGHVVFIATGKNLEDAKSIGEFLGVHNFITTNGQSISIENEIIYENCFDSKEIDYWVYLAKKNDCILGFQNNFDRYVLNSDKYYLIKEFFDLVNIKHPQKADEVRSGENVHQMIIAGDYEKIVFDKKKYKLVKWTSIGADILPINVSKGKGIEWFFKNNEEIFESYGFGDGHNDLEMFDVVDHSIAMGNSHEEVKQRANHITSDDTKDGIYNFLVKKKIIKEMLWKE
ncbi:MAG: Cof-type HAD-IIB family hydrolase [Mycoplasmatales bacterium]